MKTTLTLLTALLLAPLAALHAAEPPDWPAEVQAPFAKLKVPDLGLKPLLEPKGKRITTKDGWAEERSRLDAVWRKQLGPLPKKATELAVRVEKTEELDGCTRQLITFETGDGDRIRAYLLVPGHLRKGEKAPAVVVFHQSTKDTILEPVGLGKDQTLANGLHLVKRGYVVLCPECYILKEVKRGEEVGTRWPGLTGLGKMTFDASRCIDFLVSLAYVDAERIGCLGHSLGAKGVLYAMAFEPRYRVGVFNEGGIGLRMSNWTDPWYLTAAFKPNIPELEHHQLLALCAPRAFLVLGGDNSDGDASWPFIHAALPVYRLLDAGDRIGLVNHRKGHTYPTQARRQSYRWLDHWLHHRPTEEEVGP
jgi:dienelactone hydrolase